MVPAADPLVDLLASWGAGVEAGSAEILDALISFGAPERLKSIHRRAAALLSPPLAAGISEAIELLESGDSWKAPSFRARLDELVARAAEELGGRAAGEREAAAAALGRWAGVLPWIESSRLLEVLWSTEPGEEVEASLDALERIEGLGRELATARDRLRGELERRIASAKKAGLEGREEVQAAGEALRQDDPSAMARSLAILSGGLTDQGRAGAAAGADDARRRLEALHEEGMGLLTDAAGPLEATQARALEEALNRAAASEAPAATARWIETLGRILPELRRTAADARTTRQEVAASLAQDLERVGLGAAGEIAALRDNAAAGGAGWVEAVTRSLEAIARRETELAANVTKGAAPLRAACQRMTALLEKESRHLPVARVVQARLWLEQAEGLIAEGELEGMAALTESLAQETKALEGLARLTARRQRSREDSDKETARREIGRLKEAAVGRAAAGLEGLEKEIAGADAAGLARLREKALSIEASIESEVRTEAGLLLHAADRIKGGKAAEVARAAQAVRDALGKDDLSAARASTAELRQKVYAAAPLTRPALRMSLAAVAAALVIGGAASVRFFSSGPASCRLILVSPPSTSVTLKLVSGGSVAAQAAYGPSDTGGIALRLPEGHYEIYVNDRYTGRAFQVPGETEVSGIPLPAGGRP